MRWEALDGRNTGHSIDEASPERLNTLTYGADNSHPSNSDAVARRDAVIRRPAWCPRRHRNCTTGQGPLIRSAPTHPPAVAAHSPHDHAPRRSPHRQRSHTAGLDVANKSTATPAPGPRLPASRGQAETALAHRKTVPARHCDGLSPGPSGPPPPGHAAAL